MFDYVVAVTRDIPGSDDLRFQFCKFSNGKKALKFACEVWNDPLVCSVNVSVLENDDET